MFLTVGCFFYVFLRMPSFGELHYNIVHSAMSFPHLFGFSHFMVLFPDMIVFLGAVVLIFLSALRSSFFTVKFSYFLCFFFLFISFLAFLFGVGRVWWADCPLFDSILLVDFYTDSVKLFVIFLFFFSLIQSYYYFFARYNFIVEYPALLLLLASALFMLISSFDFVVLYLSLEWASLLLVIFISFDFLSNSSVEAAAKYYCVSVVAIGLFLFGVSLIYASTGDTSFLLSRWLLFFSSTSISAAVPSPLFLMATLLVIAGFLIKLGLFPFHYWVSDVYEGAPLPVMYTLSVIIKLALFASFFRVFQYAFGSIVWFWQPILIFSSVGSLLLGSVAAFSETNLRRFIAMASVNQQGFVLVCFSALPLASQKFSFLFFFTYAFSSASFFLILVILNRKSLLFRQRPLYYLSDLAFFFDYSFQSFVLRIFMSVVIFSFLGVPPFLGFFSKFFVLSFLAHNGFFFLFFVSVVSSLLSAYYYLSLIKFLLFLPKKSWNFFSVYVVSLRPVSFTVWILLAATTFFLFFSVFFLNNLLNFFNNVSLVCGFPLLQFTLAQSFDIAVFPWWHY